jgi:DNA-binding NarL/FixJ family response regulator
MDPSGARSTPSGQQKLTARERQIARLLALGQSNKEVAGNLDISTRTAENHRASLMHKLDLRSLADLVRYAIRNGIIEV